MTRLFRLAALTALFVLPLAVSAQRAAGERGADRSERSPDDRGERHLERLTERLSLTDSQVAMVKASMDGERTAGSSWDLAARLTPTLSAAQMEALKAPRQRGDRSARGERAQDGEASGERAERQQERAKEREERRAESQAARDAALGLSAAQKQALESARSERQALPAGMADVLTDDQEAVLLVHRALSSPRGRGGRGGKGGRGMGRGGRR